MKKLPRILRAVGLVVVALLFVSTASNLAFDAFEKASIKPYGERVSIEAGHLNVSVTGEGKPTVVLLSGYGTASPVLDFAPLVRELDNTFRVIVVERFGYGFSDLDVTDRTVKNISIELHQALADLGANSYILLAHSLAAIYSLDYVNRFPGEVSALFTLDGTVPEDFAVASAINGGLDRFLAAIGWVRWMIELNPGITAPSAPAGVYSTRELERIRLMTIWNYANPSMIDENNRSAENFSAVKGLSFPTKLPVLAFVSQQLIDANPQWLPAHEKQLESVDRSEVVVLDGGHYQHWTHSREIGDAIKSFLD